MRRIYVGKTKDVFALDDGNTMLLFKDTVTGTEGRIDSGANEIIGEMEGKGGASLRSLSTSLNFCTRRNTYHYVGMGQGKQYYCPVSSLVWAGGHLP